MLPLTGMHGSRKAYQSGRSKRPRKATYLLTPADLGNRLLNRGHRPNFRHRLSLPTFGQLDVWTVTGHQGQHPSRAVLTPFRHGECREVIDGSPRHASRITQRSWRVRVISPG